VESGFSSYRMGVLLVANAEKTKDFASPYVARWSPKLWGRCGICRKKIRYMLERTAAGSAIRATTGSNELREDQACQRKSLRCHAGERNHQRLGVRGVAWSDSFSW